jgi:hypothetical protein
MAAMDIDDLFKGEESARIRKAAERALDGEQVTLVVGYFKLNPVCGYCGKPAVVIRTTYTMDGDIAVATLCEKDAEGEARAECTGKGLVAVGTGARFMNAEVYGEIPEEAQAVPFYLQKKEPH